MLAISMSIYAKARLSQLRNKAALALGGVETSGTMYKAFLPEEICRMGTHELRSVFTESQEGKGKGGKASELSSLHCCGATSGSTIKQDASSPASGPSLPHLHLQAIPVRGICRA